MHSPLAPVAACFACHPVSGGKGKLEARPDQFAEQGKILWSDFSTMPSDPFKMKLLVRFDLRWKVWTKNDIHGALGSGGLGNAGNRDF